jgi:AhpD family alkylhydroperoxidase
MRTLTEETIMEQRLDFYKANPAAVKALIGVEERIGKSALEKSLTELVRLRASQINGCAYCLDMHTKDARRAGETEQRIYALSAWRETPFFTERERAALDWTEALTRVADTHVPDDVFERVSKQFKEEELVALTFGVVVINAWNRLAISLRPPVGSYQSAAA